MRILLVVAIVDDRSRGTIEQVEPRRGPHPEMALAILQKRPHFIARERCRIARIVPEHLQHLTVAIQPVEATIASAYPERAAAIFQQLIDEVTAQCPRVAGYGAEMKEGMLGRLQPIESGVRADPEIAGAVADERGHLIAGERAGVAVSCRRCVKRPLRGSSMSRPASAVPIQTRPLPVDRQDITSSLAREPGSCGSWR